MIRALEKLAGHLGKQPLHLVDPGGICRCEVHVKPGMLGQPGVDGGMLMRGIVVTDHVDIKVFRDGLVDLDQELLKLHRSVPAVNRRNHRPVSDVERCEQTCGAVPGSIGNAGWDCYKAWTWLFSSTDNTTADSGGFK